MAKGTALPEEDEVARWIKPKLLGRDDNGAVLVDDEGRPLHVFPEAFELRPDEDSLSVTWLQYFGLGRQDHLAPAADAIRESTKSKKLSPNSAFAIASVAALKAAALEHINTKLRVLEDPVPGNPAHTEVRRYPVEMTALQVVLAATIFSERHLYHSISG